VHNLLVSVIIKSMITCPVDKSVDKCNKAMIFNEQI